MTLASATESFPARYRRLSQRIHGSCPIEQGHLASLVDNECVHGSLPIDKPTCDCWPDEVTPKPLPKPRRRTFRKITPEDVDAILASSELQGVLAIRYGVSQATISYIKVGRGSRAA